MTIFGDNTPVWVQNLFGSLGLAFVLIVVYLVAYMIVAAIAERRQRKATRERTIKDNMEKLKVYQLNTDRLRNGDYTLNGYLEAMHRYENRGKLPW